MMYMLLSFVIWIMGSLIPGAASMPIERKTVIGEDAKCIDGSPPLYYIRKGSDGGINKWHIHFQGGGWCFNEQECFLRMSDILGSSRAHAGRRFEQAFKQEPYLSDSWEENPLMYNWNVVYVHYCDGSSWASDTEVVHNGKTMQFRGVHNRRLLMSTLVEHEGMQAAEEVLFSGCSAGALGLYMGIDDMADSVSSHPAVLAHKAQVQARSQTQPVPSIQFRGLADSGFFMNFNRTSDPDFKINRKMVQRAGLGAEFQLAIADTFALTNMAAGVPAPCLAYMRAASLPAYYCAYGEYLVNFVRTPVFLKQSQFDTWQNGNILRTFFPPGVNKFGQMLANAMLSTLVFRSNPAVDYALVDAVMGHRSVQGAATTPPHGLYIHSCSSHCSVCRAGGDQRVFTLHTINATSGRSGDITEYTTQAAFDQWYKHKHTSVGGSVTLPTGRQLRKRGGDMAGDHPGVSPAELLAFQQDSPHRVYVQNLSYPCSHCCRCIQ